MSKVLFLLASYLVGAIPTGYILFRIKERRDVRTFGSGSTGATNIFRLAGLAYALPVVVFDVLKGFVPAFLALRFFGDIRMSLAAGALAVIGHCYPVYIGFRGGKGVATSMGAFLCFSWPGALVSLGVFVLVITLTRYVSLGSLLAAFSFPVWSLVFLPGTIVFYGSAVVALVIVIRHGGNIERLITGRERKLGQKEAKVKP